MIKLDPEDEADDDEEEKPLIKLNQKQVVMHPSGNVQGGGNSNTQTVNNVHMNNVQINLTRVNLPSEFQNYVSQWHHTFK
mgnify:FL=1